MSAEQHEFRTEVSQLLDLMIHSLYTNKDVFLRELISNASDALDRRRFAALTDSALGTDDELHIRLETDPATRTVTVRDNGIGMSRDELVENLGTIARSGTREFLQRLKEAQGENVPPELIGEFGVGFYSSFMVADRVTVVTRKAGEESATRWRSAGDGYTLEPAGAREAGTAVTLELRPADAEDGLRDYADEHALRELVQRYSDFVAYPIKMRVERPPERPPGAESPAGVLETPVVHDETLNSMKAIWTRPADEVSEDEYKEFYKHIAHDWSDPLEVIRGRMEGNFEASLLLFIPAQAPFDLYYRDMARRGVQLYVKRVFVMDECRDLLPDSLRFVRGVIDSEDLSLNVSREMLQQDRQIQAIRAFAAKKVYDSLKDLLHGDRAKYERFWTQFGPALKEGLLGYDAKKERVLDLVLAPSTREPDEQTTLGEYIERMPEGQSAIYCALGSTREAALESPHLEAFRERGYEVLLLTDPVDEVWLQTTAEYRDRKLQAIGKGEVELGSDEEKRKAEASREADETEYGDLLKCLRRHLQDDVDEVRLSSRLTTSPACLVGAADDLSPQLQEMMRRMGQDVPRTKRSLELNPAHATLAGLRRLFERDPTADALGEYARLLYGQALLAEGSPLPDPAAYSRLVASVLAKALEPA